MLEKSFVCLNASCSAVGTCRLDLQAVPHKQALEKGDNRFLTKSDVFCLTSTVCQVKRVSLCSAKPSLKKDLEHLVAYNTI